jgi:hypothetical protein
MPLIRILVFLFEVIFDERAALRCGWYERMAEDVGTVTRAEQHRRLDAEYGAAVTYAIAILRAHGMSSTEFRAAEDAAGDLWIRLCETPER